MSYHLPKKTIIYKDNHIPLIITPTFWTPQKRTNPELRVGCWGTNNQDWRQMFPHLWHVSKTKKKVDPPPKKKNMIEPHKKPHFHQNPGFVFATEKNGDTTGCGDIAENRFTRQHSDAVGPAPPQLRILPETKLWTCNLSGLPGTDAWHFFWKCRR